MDAYAAKANERELYYEAKSKESYQIQFDNSQFARAATQESPDYASADHTTLISDDVQDDGWNIEIISITDLDGNSILLDEGEID